MAYPYTGYSEYHQTDETGQIVGSSAASGAALGTSISPGYGTAIGAAAGLIYGGIMAHKAANKPIPENVASAQLLQAKARADEESGYGFTAGQNAAFKESVSRSNNLSFRNAVARAGAGVAGTVTGGIQANTLVAENQRAIQDAQLKLQKQHYADSFVPSFQHISDTNVARAYDIYGKEQNAAGNLVHSGITNALWLLANAESNKTGADVPTTTTSTPTSTTSATPSYNSATGAKNTAINSVVGATHNKQDFINTAIKFGDVPATPDFSTEGAINNIYGN